MADYLFIDDNSVEGFKIDGLDIIDAAPDDRDAQREALATAWVVMVDWQLGDLGDRPIDPVDGFDVAGLMRSRVLDQRKDECVSFCLYSGKLDEVRGNYPRGLYRNHALARARDVDWVFDRPERADEFKTVAGQLRSLKDAAVRITEVLQSGRQGKNALLPLLGLEQDSELVSSVIDDARPPAHQALLATNGRSLLQWLLHRILPYPTFLIDEHQLAARCRLSIDALREGLNKSEGLSRFWNSGQYHGVLGDFLGKRWWLHEIDQTLWDMTEGKSFDPIALRRALGADSVRDEDVVLCIDENYAWEKELTPVDRAVRVAPEDWPTFARPAWMRIDLLDEFPDLREFVVPMDLEALGGA